MQNKTPHENEVMAAQISGNTKILGYLLAAANALGHTTPEALAGVLEAVPQPAARPPRAWETLVRVNVQGARDLPTSRAFKPDPKNPEALKPDYSAAFEKVRVGLRFAPGTPCACCGMREGDPYEYVTPHPDGTCTVELRASRGPQAAHMSNCPANPLMAPLCPVCHGYADTVHRCGAGRLTSAGKNALTAGRLQSALAYLRAVAQQHPLNPLGVLGVGGADLITAVALDRHASAKPDALLLIVPELGVHPRRDLELVIAAALFRLGQRGLLREDDQLRRALVNPAAEEREANTYYGYARQIVNFDAAD